jgi:hypothetical protein
MKNKIRKNRALLQPFQTGQIWKMEDSNLEIGLIGKTLVHYKHYRVQMKGSPVSLSNKDTLERYLQDKEAVLVRRQPVLSPGNGTGKRS